MNLGDGEAVAALHQIDVGLGVHLLGGHAGFAENGRQRNGKAACMGRAQHFFRIGAGSAFEAGDEAIRVALQRAALCRNRADAVLKAALPGGGTISAHSKISLMKSRFDSLLR